MTTQSSGQLQSESASVPSLSESQVAAQTMVDGRIVLKTRNQYKSKMKMMQAWFEQHDDLRDHFHLPFRNQDVLAFFGSLATRALSKKHPHPLQMSTVRGYKSALMWYYKQASLEIDKGLNVEIENFLQGYKRKVAEMKLNGEMPVFEGKHAITFTGYQILAQKFMQLKPERFESSSSRINTWNLMSFAWAFFVLQWNLMARCSEVAHIMLQHISWEEDCMIISTPKHKGDQEGANCFPNHVFANPLQPFICPILALAVLIFSTSYRYGSEVIDKDRLFAGDNQEDRFSKALERVLKRLNEHEAAQLGAKINEISTHSARKGAATYCSGMVAGPSIVQIFLRAGWTLGQVQARYLFNGNGGDQFTGRVVCGLPNGDCSFATLPPHFDDSLNLTTKDWNEILPRYKDFPHAFKQVAIHLLASIVYHEPWLRQTLGNRHPLFSTYLFQSGKIKTFKRHVSITSNRLKATGIPPHLCIAGELVSVAERVDACKAEILLQCKGMPKLLTDTMLSKFNVNGAIPVTMDDMKKFMNDIMEEMKTLQSSNPATTVNSDDTIANGNPTFDWYCWGGKMHMVPANWVLPTSNVKNIWNLWWFGHLTDRIQPYRHLGPDDFVTRAQKVQLTKTRKVMEGIEKVARQNKHIRPERNVQELSKEENVKLFDLAYTDLLKLLFNTSDSSRFEEASIATLYDHINSVKNRSREAANVYIHWKLRGGI